MDDLNCAKSTNFPQLSLFILLLFALDSLTALGQITQGSYTPSQSGWIQGQFDFEEASYKLPAKTDPLILGDRKTELWAHVWLPTQEKSSTIDTTNSTNSTNEETFHSAHPLILMLHGNHPTCGRGQNPRIDDHCGYTNYGTCPSGYQVVNNHMGYEYLARTLASWGYAVVSINANRGITCGSGVSGDGGLNLARGRLVLSHLELLSEWSRNKTPLNDFPIDLKDKLDFNHVGLMGHSRGGEGVRAAYNILNSPGNPWQKKLSPIKVGAIFEIAPVDGQTSQILDARDTQWHVLLPLCDGDIYNFQGIKPFDRMLRSQLDPSKKQKSASMVLGANHNFFNTEWQESDSTGCAGYGNQAIWDPNATGSERQRKIGLAAVVSFFRSSLGPNISALDDQFFNPYYAIGQDLRLITDIEREFVLTPDTAVTITMDNFAGYKNVAAMSSYGFPHEISPGVNTNLVSLPMHDQIRKTTRISWQSSASKIATLQSNWMPKNQGRDVSSYKTLDLSLSRDSSMQSTPAPTDFSIQLVMADESVSDSVQLSQYADLRGPYGSQYSRSIGQISPLLKTIRIPLSDFNNVDLSSIRGVRFIFDKTVQAILIFADLRFSMEIEGVQPAFLAFDTAIDNATERSISLQPSSELGQYSALSTPRKIIPKNIAQLNGRFLGSKVRLRGVLRSKNTKTKISLSDLASFQNKIRKLNSTKVQKTSTDDNPELIKVQMSFQVGHDLPLAGALLPFLVVDGKTFNISSVESLSDSSEQYELSFVVDAEEFTNITDKASMFIGYGDPENTHKIYAAGNFEKSADLQLKDED
ncbi:MAG: hypothetical protein KBD78_16470 [Oligoflexales bacterium]|nr:hypothetical protein [Oligoflexales bacterium]